MSTTGWVILAIVVGVVVIAALAMMASRSRRSAALRDRFGPEYDRTVESAGSRRTAWALPVKPVATRARTRWR